VLARTADHRSAALVHQLLQRGKVSTASASVVAICEQTEPTTIRCVLQIDSHEPNHAGGNGGTEPTSDAQKTSLCLHLSSPQ